MVNNETIFNAIAIDFLFQFSYKVSNISHTALKKYLRFLHCLGMGAKFGLIKVQPVATWLQLCIPKLASQFATGRMKSMC